MSAGHQRRRLGQRGRGDGELSEIPRGDGWWIASDGKWYPPHLHPDVLQEAPADAPVELPTGWWLASDGQWYPPEAHPGYAPSHATPDPDPEPAESAETGEPSGVPVGARRVPAAAERSPARPGRGALAVREPVRAGAPEAPEAQAPPEAQALPETPEGAAAADTPTSPDASERPLAPGLVRRPAVGPRAGTSSAPSPAQAERLARPPFRAWTSSTFQSQPGTGPSLERRPAKEPEEFFAAPPRRRRRKRD